MPESRLRIREPAHLGLELFVGVVHDVGVGADPGDDKERVLAFGAVDMFEPDAAGVDGAHGAADGTEGRRGNVVERNLHVPGQQVPGAQRNESQAGLGAPEDFRHGTHRPVAAGGNDHVASGLQRPACGALPGVVGFGFKDQGCGEPCLGTHVFNGGDRLFGAGLGRIEHQRNLAGGRRDADFWHQDLGPVAVNEPTHGEPTQRRGDARGACRNEGNKSIALHSALSLTGIARLRS